MPKNKNIKEISTTPVPESTNLDSSNVSYVFPKSEEIIIPRSDLQIQLQNFKKAVLASISVFDLLAIISLWSPVFANTFVPVMSLSSDEVRAGYVVMALILTIIILYNKLSYQVLKLFGKYKNVSPEPEKMSEIIRDKCQKK